MAYIGKSPSNGIRNRFIYTATAGQTSFSGSDDHDRTLNYNDAEFVDVFLNGVKLDKSDYTATSGTSVVLDEGAAADDILEVLAFDVFSVFSGEFSQDVTVGGTLDANGNVDVAGTLHVSGTAPVLRLTDTDTGADSEISASSGFGSLFIDVDKNNEVASSGLLMRIDGTERMRIDSGGDVLIGSSTNVGTGDHKVSVDIGATGRALGLGTSSTTAKILASFINGNGTVGSIQTSGTATSYVTSSDYRLKENVVDVTDGITRIKQLDPKRFNFTADATTTVDGFLAHEVQSVVPEAVHGTHNEVDDDGNAVYQGIDQSKLVPLLTAALQEAITKIETLETKVAALEAN